MRTLDERFLSDLEGGILEPLTSVVRSDTSLCLELRGDSVNIYYRGGSLMKVEKRSAQYGVVFDMNYFGNRKAPLGITSTISNQTDANEWTAVVPKLKQVMDRHFSKHRADEREFQQLLVRENNFGRFARSTDYYICDIEYQHASFRFDAIAVHWPSESSARKDAHHRRLVFIEMKYGDKALTGKAGLHQHIQDINTYLGQPGDYVMELKEDMKNVFRQKRHLGLIDCRKDLEGFGSDDQPLLLLVLANHDPGKRKLRDLLEGVPDSPHAELRIATASFLGYGMYDQGVHTVEEAFRRFGDYIHKDLSPIPDGAS